MNNFQYNIGISASITVINEPRTQLLQKAHELIFLLGAFISEIVKYASFLLGLILNVFFDWSTTSSWIHSDVEWIKNTEHSLYKVTHKHNRNQHTYALSRNNVSTEQRFANLDSK